MNQVGEVEVKPKRGRPPKVKVEETVPSDVTWIFKSKFREDVVNLRKGYKERNPDGSTTFHAGYDAEFHRNTWPTKDPVLAQLLRDKIEERKNLNPLHIIETTQVDTL